MKAMSIYLLSSICVSQSAFARFVPKKLATGVYHTCALSEDGRVKCWGDNAYGELGTGDYKNIGQYPDTMGPHLPVVNLGTGVLAKDICGGQGFTCAAMSDGRVKCWGMNHVGQLAHGNKIHSLEMGDKLPFSDLGTSFKAVSLACGDFHACALSDAGLIKCWGKNEESQLGNNQFGNVGDSLNSIGDNMVAVPITKPALSISAGRKHTCASYQDGARCWGYGFKGALGQEISNQMGTSTFPIPPNLPPIKLDLDTVKNSVLQVTAGRDISCALFLRNIDLQTYMKCWGENYFYQLAADTGSHGAQSDTMGWHLPFADLDLDSIAHIQAHSQYGCALNRQGLVKCWGRNYDGELGLGNALTPQLGKFLPYVQLDLPVKSLSVGSLSFHSCAILVNSQVKCWGRNEYGQLGYEHTSHLGANPNDMGENLPSVRLE